MEEYDMILEFPVTIDLGKGDEKDLSVMVNATEEEFDLLVNAYIDGGMIDSDEGFDDLYNRIITAVNNEFDRECGGNGEELNNAHYDISYPEEVIEEAEPIEETEDERSLKDIDDITKDELVDVDDLVHAFEEYLMDNSGYSKDEAEFAALGMKDPYNAPYIYGEYEGRCEFDGIEYQVQYCKTNFGMCGLFELADLKPFEFYMLIDETSMPDETVDSYTKAPKKYCL